MRILFISKNLIAADLAVTLKKEGHDVLLCIDSKKHSRNLDNFVNRTKTWKDKLDWVGKDGLIVFDDVGYGATQDRLRKKGYIVFGGSKLADRLELEREYAQEIFREYGLKTVLLKDFDNMDDAAMFVKKNPSAWVIKQNNQSAKYVNYVGQMDNGEDVFGVLANYLHNPKVNSEKISLQQKIDGVEIGIGRYFNGFDWVGPIEYNLEHTSFFPGDLGPLTSEMGTIAWYDSDENNPLFKATLAKLKEFLTKANFRGDFEINCIVNKDGIFPLEATPRFGTPIVHLHEEIHDSPWGEFLYAVASGQSYDLKWKKGYGIVVLLATPPFPYSSKIAENMFYGMTIHFKNITPEDMKHIHFEEVSVRTNGHKHYYISDHQGYLMYVTSIADTVEEAQKKLYSIPPKIIIPKMFYRNDIGTRFVSEDRAKLIKWGYLKA